jgi:glycosyltransferase involved in cell wall biosynthesis
MNFVSVVIPTCKISEYLWETIDSVLVADSYQSVDEIIVVPNAGPNNSDLYSAISEKYQNTKVIVHQRMDKVIIPIAANWNYCVSVTSSKLVHILHDDDLVSPHFYQQLLRLHITWPDAALYYQACVNFGKQSGYTCPVNTEGPWEEARVTLASRNFFMCPGVVFSRYDFRGFDENLSYCCDWKAWYYLSTKNQTIVSPYAAASYRWHQTNLTASIVKSGKNIDELYATEVCLLDDLSKENIRPISRLGSFTYGLGLNEAHQCYNLGDYDAALLQIRKISQIKTSKELTKFYYKILIKKIFAS